MIKLLTIGNSFTMNATRYLDGMMASEKDIQFIIGKANIAGCSLEKHWNLYKQLEFFQDLKPYCFYKTGDEPFYAALTEILTCEDWDFVTLQQVSNLSWRMETYKPYINNLYDIIKKLAPQAKLVIHQTWAYRIDAKELIEFGITQEEMYELLCMNYLEIANEFKCEIIPCGRAFQIARADFKYSIDKEFDFVNAYPPLLPEQSKSLIVGYYWETGMYTQTGKAELAIDGKHANDKGCYLASAVWYEFFTKRSIFDNRYFPPDVSEKDLELLRKSTHQAIVELK